MPPQPGTFSTSRGRAWLTLTVAFTVLSITFGFSVFAWPAFYRPLTVARGWTFTEANAGGALVLLCIGLASPWAGAWIDRFSPKRVILAGTATAAMAMALLSRAESLPAYYASCVLLGAGVAGASIVPVSILVASHFARRGLAVGVANAGVGVGGFVAPRLVTREIVESGIPDTFLTLALWLVIPFLLMWLVAGSGMTPAQASVIRVPAARELVRTPMFWSVGVALLLTALGMLGVQQNLMSYLTGASLAAAEAALVLSSAMAVASLGKIACGLAADRVGAIAATAGSIACVALGVAALIAVDPQSASAYMAAVVFGFGYGGVFNAVPVLAFESFGTRQVGAAMGLFYVFFGLGTSGGGELSALLFDATGQWSIPFAVDLVLVCSGLAVLLAARTWIKVPSVAVP